MFNLLIIVSSTINQGIAQIRIEILKHPPFTASDSSIYLSSNFNNWSPAEENYKLTKDARGFYYIDLPDTLSYFEYKFTQGSWALVEGTQDGRVRSNRIYKAEKEINPKRLAALPSARFCLDCQELKEKGLLDEE